METNLAPAIVGIRTYRAKLGKRRKEIEATLAQVDTDMAAVDRMLLLLHQEMQEAMPKDAHTSPRAEITVDDIRHCETQEAVMRTYAQLNNGLAHITAVTDLIMEVGMSKGKRSSVRSTVYNYTQKKPEQWQWEQPGTFRWLGFGRVPLPDRDELRSQEQPGERST